MCRRHTRVANQSYGAAMHAPMTLDLLNSLEIVDDDVMAVVNVYLANPGCGPVSFGEGYQIDPAAAVAEHPFASTLMRQPWANHELRQAAVRAAIMLAQPQRA
jgi:hypothetical protein